MFKHVPNILTMCRFVLIPFIFGSIVNNQYVAAFVFLTLSGITDILDGFIARKFKFVYRKFRIEKSCYLKHDFYYYFSITFLSTVLNSFLFTYPF